MSDMIYLLHYVRRKWVYSLKEVKTLKSSKKIIRAVQVAVVLIVFIGGICWVRYARVHEYKGYAVVEERSLYSNTIDYTVGNNRLLVYSNDGAKAIDGAGAMAWEISYQLDKPQIAYCGDVAAVADIGGTSVYVVAENGIPYRYDAVYPIVKHEVAKQGVTALLLDNDTEDYIQLYDINGTLRVDINTKTKIDGIPIDIALSPDGKKLVTLYVTFQGDSMICKATFYNADEVGKNYINNIVGQKIFAEDVLAYDVRFLNEEVLCVLLENGFTLYRMTERPELICENVLEEKIEEIVCVEGGFYIIKEDAAKKRTMTFYNEKGEEKQTFEELPEYETISATAEEIVFFSPQRVTVYRNNGSLKFSTAFAQNLENVFPAGGNRYFLVDVGKVQMIKLSKDVNDGGK